MYFITSMYFIFALLPLYFPSLILLSLPSTYDLFLFAFCFHLAFLFHLLSWPLLALFFYPFPPRRRLVSPPNALSLSAFLTFFMLLFFISLPCRLLILSLSYFPNAFCICGHCLCLFLSCFSYSYPSV